jgi:Sec7-like guanine-nucleotide exchange factor
VYMRAVYAFLISRLIIKKKKNRKKGCLVNFLKSVSEKKKPNKCFKKEKQISSKCFPKIKRKEKIRDSHGPAVIPVLRLGVVAKTSPSWLLGSFSFLLKSIRV